MKRILTLTAMMLLAAPAFAQNNIGSCGWGSKLFEGDRGPAPQVLGATTNGTFGNQTFGISSNTSGCTRDAEVTSGWKTVMFIDMNKSRLAQNMAQGQGESLEAFETVMNVQAQDRAEFAQVAKNNFGSIFPREDVSTEEVAASLREVLSASPALSKYSVAL